MRGESAAEIEARFLKEAKLAGRLQHPSIVTIYDVGRDRDVCFIAMEYVDGNPLTRYLSAADTLPLAGKIGIIRQVADALAHAHERGVLHRDIKPGNILIAKDGRVKVTDFGIGKFTAAATSDLTRTGQMIGSPAYMSPEQIRGEKVDSRSDLFSLGVVLYELLTGVRPFPGDSITTLVYQILHTEPRDPRELRADLPASTPRGHGVPAGQAAGEASGQRAGVRPRAQAHREIPARLGDDAARGRGAPSRSRKNAGRRAAGPSAAPAFRENVRPDGAGRRPERSSDRPSRRGRRSRGGLPASPRPRPHAAVAADEPGAAALGRPDSVARGRGERARGGGDPCRSADPGTRRGRRRDGGGSPDSGSGPAASHAEAAASAGRGTGGEGGLGRAAARPAAPDRSDRPERVDAVYETRRGVRFTSSPEQARLYVDGRYIGIADDWDNRGGGRQLEFEKPGTHYVRMELPGYRAMHLQIDVTPRGDDSVSIDEELDRNSKVPYEKLPSPSGRTTGDVEFLVHPSDAVVSEGERTLGPVSSFGPDSPLRLRGPMVHDLLLSAPGYKPRLVRILVSENAGADRARVEEKLKSE